MEIYHGKSDIINSELTVYENGSNYSAVSTGVDDMSGLVVQAADGKEKHRYQQK